MERSGRRWLAGLAVLMAWAPVAARAAPERAQVWWPERQWVFVADRDGGTVQVLAVRSGLTPVAVLRQRERTAVRGIAVDPRGARAWVLGPRGLDQHDAASGRLLARYVAPEGVELEGFEPADGHSLRVRGGGRLFEPRPGCGCLARVAVVPSAQDVPAR